jgi:hypothetical protein
MLLFIGRRQAVVARYKPPLELQQPWMRPEIHAVRKRTVVAQQLCVSVVAPKPYSMSQAHTELQRSHFVIQNVCSARHVLLQAGTGITSTQLHQVQQWLRNAALAAVDTSYGCARQKAITSGQHQRRSALAGLSAALTLAQQLMGHAIGQECLHEAEGLLCSVIELAETVPEDSSSDDDDDDDADDACHIDRQLNPMELRSSARALLALLLAQQRRDQEAARLLVAAGYEYRLAPDILSYCASQGAALAQSTGLPSPGPDASPFVQALDGALPSPLLQAMQVAFAPGSLFWSAHGYKLDGSTPYFSYAHSLHTTQQQPTSQSLLDQV